MNDRDAHDGIAEQARAQRDDHERRIEAEEGVDPGEQHEADAERHDAEADDDLRPEAVHRPAEDRAEDRSFRRFHRGGAGDGGLAPAAIFDQDREIDTEGLVQQQALQRLQGAAGEHDAPAVENFHEMPGRIAQAVSSDE